MGNRIDWTDERKAQLQCLLAEGLTYRQAAERMDIRRDQAKSAANTYRLAPRRPRRKWREWPRAEYDRLEALMAAGLTYPQIAERMQLGINEVKGAAQRLGLMSPERLGRHRIRHDWPEIDRIVTDCIEAQLMTIPQAHRHLRALGLGQDLAVGTLYRRLEAIDHNLRVQADRNAKRRNVAIGHRIQLARKAKRRQQQAA